MAYPDRDESADELVVDTANPFAGSIKTLANTLPEIRCRIYSNLSEWHDIQAMARALLAPVLIDELYDCLEQIDFTNGTGLNAPNFNWLKRTLQPTSNLSAGPIESRNLKPTNLTRLKAVNALKLLSESRFSKLTEVRFSDQFAIDFGREWTDELTQTYQQQEQAILDDPRFRFLQISKRTKTMIPESEYGDYLNDSITNPDHDAHSIYQYTQLRLQRWGFRFELIYGENYMWNDGFVYLEISILLGLYNAEYSLPEVHTLCLIGFNDDETVQFNSDETFPNLTRLILSVKYGIRSMIPIGSKVTRIEALFSQNMAFGPEFLEYWLITLLEHWGRDRRNDSQVYPQVTELLIPITSSRLRDFETMFPNVKQFMMADNKITRNFIAQMRKYDRLRNRDSRQQEIEQLERNDIGIYYSPLT